MCVKQAPTPLPCGAGDGLGLEMPLSAFAPAELWRTSPPKREARRRKALSPKGRGDEEVRRGKKVEGKEGNEEGRRKLLSGCGRGRRLRGFGDAVRDGIHLHQRLDAVSLLLELGELPAGKLQPARHCDGHRVDEVVVDQDLEVTMRAG